MTPIQFLVRCSKEGIRIVEEAGALSVHGAASEKADRIESYVQRHDKILRQLLGMTPRTVRPVPTHDAESLLSPDEFAELADLGDSAEVQYRLFQEASWNGLPRLVSKVKLPSGVYVMDPNPHVRGIQHRASYAMKQNDEKTLALLMRDMDALTEAIKDTRSIRAEQIRHKSGQPLSATIF